MHLCSSVILFYSFLFCGVFVWFWYQADTSLNKIESVPFSLIFVSALRKIGVKSSFNVLWVSPIKPSGPGLLFVWSLFKLLIQFITVYSYFVFLIDLVLRDCTLLVIYPFLLNCPFYWCIIVLSTLMIFSSSEVFVRFSLERLYISSNLSISSELSNLLVYNCSQYSHDFFVVLGCLLELLFYF